MIQFTESLADAYVTPRRNVAMPSLPGRQVKFLQGHAQIKDGRDLAAMLRRPDVLLVLTDYSSSWIEEIEKAAGQIRAEVRRPERAAHSPATGGTASDASVAPALGLEPSVPPPKRRPVWIPPADWPRNAKGQLLSRKAIAELGTHGPDSPEPDS